MRAQLTMPHAAVRAFALLVVPLLAGCVFFDEPELPSYEGMGYDGDDPAGRQPGLWPNLLGHTVRVLDNGVLTAMGATVTGAFENLTGGKLVVIPGPDSGDALAAILEAAKKGKPMPADAVYGLDQPRMLRLAQSGLADPYEPLVANARLLGDLWPQPFKDKNGNWTGGFVDEDDTWYGTPTAHAMVAVVMDQRSPDLLNVTPPDFPHPIQDLYDIRLYADELVVPDPVRSGRGLAFLLATVQSFGEGGKTDYEWNDYWRDLFAGPDRDRDHESDGTLAVAPDWATAYARFNATDPSGEHAMVVGLSTHPAWEYGRDTLGNQSRFDADIDQAPKAILRPRSAWHLVEYAAILEGTEERAAAQAFLEFTLTDAFQELLFYHAAMEPVVRFVAVDCKADLEPGCVLLRQPNVADYIPATYDAQKVDKNLDRWLCEWSALKAGDEAAFEACSAPPKKKA